MPESEWKKISIGYRGSAGGIIFYDKGTYTNGWRYLEAAPVDIGTHNWGNRRENLDVSGTWTGIGSGKRNTELIIKQRGIHAYAAQACIRYTLNGFNDWFLPSSDELSLIYINLKQFGISDFVNSGSSVSYWSSSQTSSNRAISFDFSRGTQNEYPKEYNLSIRAVRAF